MASIFSASHRALPYLSGAAIVGATGALYYSTQRRPLLLDSAQNAPTRTLSFPKTMLFSQELTVIASEQINHDTKKITFSLPGGSGEISGVPAGSAVLTQHTPAGKWFPVLRPYTPVSDPDDRGTLHLLVKQYPDGRASTHMHSLSPGQTLRIRGPVPGYSYSPSESPRNLLFVAGGAGITPIYSLARGVLGAADDQTRIQLLWGVNGTRDLVLKEELERLATQYPDRLRVTYCVSGSEGTPDAPGLGQEDRYRKGHIDKRVLRESIARCEDGRFGDANGTKVFLCGPPSMEEAIAGSNGVLAELGIHKQQIHRF